MIFPSADTEDIVQENDKTRIDARKSFITPDEAAITLFEIEAEAASGYIDVTSDQYLDWSYATAGTKTATIRITTDGAPVTKEVTLTVVDAATDNLFSSDQDLVDEEDDILTYVRDGRNSFLDKHRLSQELVMDELDNLKIFDQNGDRLTAAAVIDHKEVLEWSKYQVLMIVFDNQSNVIGDIFDDKARKYESKMLRAMNQGIIRLDSTGDGTANKRRDNISGDLTRLG